MKWILFFTIWTAAGFILGPPIGRYLKSLDEEQTNHLPPLPEGSILGNHRERELSR